MQAYGTLTLTELLALKIDPTTKAALAARAEQNQTSLSAEARQLIRAGLAAQQKTTLEVHHG